MKVKSPTLSQKTRQGWGNPPSITHPLSSTPYRFAVRAGRCRPMRWPEGLVLGRGELNDFGGFGVTNCRSIVFQNTVHIEGIFSKRGKALSVEHGDGIGQ